MLASDTTEKDLGNKSVNKFYTATEPCTIAIFVNNDFYLKVNDNASYSSRDIVTNQRSLYKLEPNIMQRQPMIFPTSSSGGSQMLYLNLDAGDYVSAYGNGSGIKITSYYVFSR